jgi:hypothetical protein
MLKINQPQVTFTSMATPTKTSSSSPPKTKVELIIFHFYKTLCFLDNRKFKKNPIFQVTSNLII